MTTAIDDIRRLSSLLDRAQQRQRNREDNLQTVMEILGGDTREVVTRPPVPPEPVINSYPWDTVVVETSPAREAPPYLDQVRENMDRREEERMIRHREYFTKMFSGTFDNKEPEKKYEEDNWV